MSAAASASAPFQYNWTLRQVARGFLDGHADNHKESQLCRHPISIHPVKNTIEYGHMWRALDVRDKHNDEELHAWRRRASELRRAAAQPIVGLF